jgi:hypothetical protein
MQHLSLFPSNAIPVRRMLKSKQVACQMAGMKTQTDCGRKTLMLAEFKRTGSTIMDTRIVSALMLIMVSSVDTP